MERAHPARHLDHVDTPGSGIDLYAFLVLRLAGAVWILCHLHAGYGRIGADKIVWKSGIDTAYPRFLDTAYQEFLGVGTTHIDAVSSLMDMAYWLSEQ
ncbi:hypothetical protein Tco_0911047 [Tanacetum coccineum]|uniref:Uncharacterized protein n=1 Tax=Tanacetum coccineum TaxID=301880 RepID=A0ABQ5CWB5_9ASTR